MTNNRNELILNIEKNCKKLRKQIKIEKHRKREILKLIEYCVKQYNKKVYKINRSMLLEYIITTLVDIKDMEY